MSTRHGLADAGFILSLVLHNGSGWQVTSRPTPQQPFEILSADILYAFERDHVFPYILEIESAVLFCILDVLEGCTNTGARVTGARVPVPGVPGVDFCNSQRKKGLLHCECDMLVYATTIRLQKNREDNT